MEDLSLHILDIAENSIRADAKHIEIALISDEEKDLFCVAVGDDGKGMDAGTLARVRDPFFTTKQKKTGLGIPLLAQAAEQAGGSLTIESRPGNGTRVTVTFQLSNVDRPATGNIIDTLMTLIAGHPDIDVRYSERRGGHDFLFDTSEVKKDLDDVPINSPVVLQAIRGVLQDHLKI